MRLCACGVLWSGNWFVFETNQNACKNMRMRESARSFATFWFKALTQPNHFRGTYAHTQEMNTQKTNPLTFSESATHSSVRISKNFTCDHAAAAAANERARRTRAWRRILKFKVMEHDRIARPARTAYRAYRRRTPATWSVYYILYIYR